MEPKTPESTSKADVTSAPVAEAPAAPAKPPSSTALPEEFGGSGKAEPTRFGDWEINGKCVDF